MKQRHVGVERVGLAATVALASGAAVAQSSVTISGMLDVGVYRDFDKSKKLGTIQRSNIAFSGQEDLGGGLYATFMLSHRLELDRGTTEDPGSGKPFWHGESTVGLKGGFGQLRLGRALDVVLANDWAYDPWYNFNRIASPAWNFWHWNWTTDRTINDGSPEFTRLANGVFYDSPSLGGFKVHFSGSFENTQTAPDAGSGNNYGLSLNYDQGPVSLMVAREKNSSGDTVTFVGGKYAFGAFALMGAWDRSVFEAATDSVAKVYTLGATYTIGATVLKAGFGHRDVDGAKTRFFGLGADYSFSKRTTAYLSLGRNDPKDGDASNAYGVGISHSF